MCINPKICLNQYISLININRGILSIMSVVGVIAEYNPFHEGHAYHLKNAKKITEASACVCVLSSNFVQRGEPAVINKWARTKIALMSGADLVIELPAAFSCASAEYFASAAVKILDSLSCVDYLCFGSEEGSLSKIEQVAQYLAHEHDDFKKSLKSFLDQGLSFAAARQEALKSINQKTDNTSDINFSSISSVLDKPNNILGIEYIKAIKRLKSNIKPVTIERVGEGYNSLRHASSFSSATAIRRYLASFTGYENILEDDFLKSNLPRTSLEVLAHEFSIGRGPVFPEAYELILLNLLRRTPEYELKKLPYVGEGLENRLKDAALTSTSIQELVSKVVTSRYPSSRIKRILCALLTGMTGEFLDELKHHGYAQYIRILGFNERGRKILSQYKKKVSLPIITKAANYTKMESPQLRRLFMNEIHSTDAYVLGYPDPRQRIGGSEFKEQPLYLK